MANGGEYFGEQDLCSPFDIRDGIVERRGSLHEAAVSPDGGRALAVLEEPLVMSPRVRTLEALLYELSQRFHGHRS